MRIVSGKQAEALVERLAARSVELSALEPRVRHIVNDVRRGGDRALRRYAEKWDGLSAKQPLQVSQDEMNAAWESLAPPLKKSLRRLRRISGDSVNGKSRARGHESITECRWGSAYSRWIRSAATRRGTLSAGVDGADDGDSGAGRRSEEYSCRIAEAIEGSAGSGGDAWGA